MDEITLKINAEQYALLQKLLEPYVKASVSLANQFRAQQEQRSRKADLSASKKETEKAKE